MHDQTYKTCCRSTHSSQVPYRPVYCARGRIPQGSERRVPSRPPRSAEHSAHAHVRYTAQAGAKGKEAGREEEAPLRALGSRIADPPFIPAFWAVEADRAMGETAR